MPLLEQKLNCSHPCPRLHISGSSSSLSRPHRKRFFALIGAAVAVGAVGDDCFALEGTDDGDGVAAGADGLEDSVGDSDGVGSVGFEDVVASLGADDGCDDG